MAGAGHHWCLPSVVAVTVWLIFAGYAQDGFAEQIPKLRSRIPQDDHKQAEKGVHALRITATLSAKPKSHRGACPATFSFAGGIKANKSGTVVYRFVRSDGSKSNPSTLSFFEPGTQAVTDTWQLGGSDFRTYEGWEAIEIVSPVTAESSKASFRLECKEEETSGGRRRRR